jgi:hypothetical protein
VPVIVIFTKFDALDNKAFKALKNEGLSRREAKDQAPERAVSDFEKVNLEVVYNQLYPPRGHVYLRGKSSLHTSFCADDDPRQF